MCVNVNCLFVVYVYIYVFAQGEQLVANWRPYGCLKIKIKIKMKNYPCGYNIRYIMSRVIIRCLTLQILRGHTTYIKTLLV